MRTLAEVFAELSDSTDIPQFLTDQGITGVRDSCYRCPIATYVLRETGADFVETYASWSCIYFTNAETGDELHSEEMLHPASVTGFIEEFDLGYHPTLDTTNFVDVEN